ncbi:MAG: hypothetical protein AAF622_01620 [Cyanobacteria bacterium P01_C01_bin.147]
MTIAFMALWLLCCVLLFVTSCGYDWLSHQSWFFTPELSLPWLVLGGLGLAIASNRHVWHLADWRWPSKTVASTTSLQTVSELQLRQTPVVSSAAQPSIETLPQNATGQAAKAIAANASISFKIASPAPADEG